MANIRIKILRKIAQTANIPSASTIQQAQQAADEVKQNPELTQTNLGKPPAFLASVKYNLFAGFEQNVVYQLDKFFHYLNEVLFYASNGQYDLFRLSQNNFTVLVPAKDSQIRLLLSFCKDAYRWILNNGVIYPEKLNKKEFEYRISQLLASYSLASLSQINITGPLANKVGNIKTNIVNNLNLIKKLTPTK
jgi:hypothetical protein